MATPSSTLNHPTFGVCEQVPELVAIKWKSPVSREAISASLAAFSLRSATADPQPRREGKRDPQTGPLNITSTLTWAHASASSQAAALQRVGSDANVDWVSPVYRAATAAGGERSYFTIDPKVLVLTAAAAAVADIAAVEGTAAIDRTRTALLRGFVVYSLPKANAIEVAAALRATPALRGLPNAVNFQNIPYLSPTCSCGCGCGGSTAPHSEASHCVPSSTPHVPDDTYYPHQWGLQRINAPSAWPISKGDPNVVIAVIDQGVELTHPDLNLWPVSYSAITHLNDGSPVGNHGTPCAGIISAKMGNGLGVTGLASECRTLAIATNFADVEVAESLYFAADQGARVVSMSFGVYPGWMVWNFAIIEAALQYCHDRNVVLVAATGNENQAVSRFPATDPRTIGVGGSNRADVRKSVGDTSSEGFWGACYGPDVDVVAPCLEIPSTDRLAGAGYSGSDYTLLFNGTSAATPHVAGLAGLLFSVDPSLSAAAVRKIISETTDKINAGGYTYLPTPSKPFGTWNTEVGYGRINVERALLVACNGRKGGEAHGPCAVPLSKPDACCVSPCDPPWRPGEQCMVWYEYKLFHLPLGGRDTKLKVGVVATNYIEFRLTYEHRICMLGKQQGPLLFTTTLLPGETIRLYHSERYRRITSAQQRYSVQTTFMQFLSAVHQAHTSNRTDALNEMISNSSKGASASVSAGLLGAIFGIGGSVAGGASSTVSSHTALATHTASEQFFQSVQQSSQLTTAERSVVVSTYEDREIQDVTVRTIQNANECRAITYFVRQVMELYAISTRVSDILYRIVASNVPPEWHPIDDLDWLPTPAIRNQILQFLRLLPKVGEVVERPKPITLPTDGVIYDPELAHCCSCEPERQAAIALRLEKQKAEALRSCLETQVLQLELQRRQLLLQRGELAPFLPQPLPAPAG